MAQPADNVDADFADLEIGHAVTVKGGCLKKEELLETRRTRCGKTFVKLDKTAPWLSRVVTGKAPCGRPLSRTNIIEFMRAQLHKSQIADEAPAATDDPGDPMAAMDYDDMEHASAVAEPALATPRKHRKRARRRRVEEEQIVSMAFPADILDGSTDIHGDGGRRVTLLACAKHIWLHVDDVAWVIQVITTSTPQAESPHCRRTTSALHRSSAVYGGASGIPRGSAGRSTQVGVITRRYASTSVRCTVIRSTRPPSRMPMLPCASGNGVSRPVMTLEQA